MKIIKIIILLITLIISTINITDKIVQAKDEKEIIKLNNDNIIKETTTIIEKVDVIPNEEIEEKLENEVTKENIEESTKNYNIEGKINSNKKVIKQEEKKKESVNKEINTYNNKKEEGNINNYDNKNEESSSNNKNEEYNQIIIEPMDLNIIYESQYEENKEPKLVRNEHKINFDDKGGE